MLKNIENLDANETIFFQRQLEYLKSKTYDVKYAKLSAAEIFSFDTETPQFATTIKFHYYDSFGMAGVVTDYSQDLPSVEINGKEDSSIIRDLGVTFSFPWKSVKESAALGIDLSMKKQIAAQRAIMEKHDQLFWLGDSTYNITGVLSHPNIPNATVVQNAGATSTLWANKTGIEILNDLTSAVTDIITLTKGVERPNFLALTATRAQKMRNTYVGTGAGSSQSVMKQFKEDYPDIQIFEVQRLAGAFTGGAEGFLLGHNSPEYIQLQAPIPYEQLDVQAKGLMYEVPVLASNGGVTIYYPLAFTKKYGI